MTLENFNRSVDRDIALERADYHRTEVRVCRPGMIQYHRAQAAHWSTRAEQLRMVK